MNQPTTPKRILAPRIRPETEASRDDVQDAALARIGKLEIVLAATGGALHDVNNLLTVLSGHLYLLTEAVRNQPALLNKARDSRNTAERASTLIRELLSFARERNELVTVICPAKHALAAVTLSLHDFGNSDSTLRNLYTLPINEVKIDRFITADLTGEKGSSVVFRGILEILGQLDIACCAEGVESSDQLQLLDDMQCDLAQGFHICTPLPAVEIGKAVANWTASGNNRTGTRLGI